MTLRLSLSIRSTLSQARERVCALLLIVALFVLATPSIAAAQDDTDNVITDEIEENISPKDDKEDGWTFGLRLGASASLNHSKNVVGATDGLTLQLGLLLDGFIKLIEGEHEWHNTLKVEHAQSKTPQLDGFLKSVDNLAFKSLYLYRLEAAPWFGFFGRFRLDTSIFPAVDRRPEDAVVSRTDADGNVSTENIGAQEDIDLTTWFEPLVLMETVGVFAEPLSESYLTTNFKLGVGGQHIITQDGYAINDDDTTPELELVQLESSNSLGGEFEVDLKGNAAENISWGVIVNLFYPFVTSSDTDLEGADVLHVDISGKVSVKLAKWLSLDYSLSAKKLPFVVDTWQVQNVVLFTVGFDIL